jgi:hypothetical protein
MADYTFTGSIDAPAEEVWKTVRAFGDGSWMGVDMEVEGEGVGARRKIAMGPTTLTEECERLDEDQRVMGYTITEGAGMPFEDYHATMQVNPDGDASELVWSATYEPVGDPEAARATLEAIYGGGFGALKKHLER